MRGRLTTLESHLKSPRSSSDVASSYVIVGGEIWILEPHIIFLILLVGGREPRQKENTYSDSRRRVCGS
jgi:hypothetical protein